MGHEHHTSMGHSCGWIQLELYDFCDDAYAVEVALQDLLSKHAGHRWVRSCYGPYCEGARMVGLCIVSADLPKTIKFGGEWFGYRQKLVINKFS
jgi:hypothetical protein